MKSTLEFPRKRRYKFKLGKFLRLFVLSGLSILILEGAWLILANIDHKTVIAGWDTIKKGCWVEAVYLREETVLTASRSGFLTFRVKSGALVPRGELIGWISPVPGQEVNAEFFQKFQKYQDLCAERDELAEDSARINQEIRLKTGRNLIEELTALRREKDRVLQNMQAIKKKIGTIYPEVAGGLKDCSMVTAGQPGFFSSDYDGSETELTPGRLKDLDETIFRKKYRLRSPGEKVNSGAIIGKIINPFRQAVAVKVNPALTGKPTRGAEWEGMTVDGWRKFTITDIISITKDKMMIGFKSQELEPEYSLTRRRKIFMVYRRITGVSIPVQAIIKKKGRTLVRVMEKEGCGEKEIQILETDGQKAIVSGLKFGTAIISR